MIRLSDIVAGGLRFYCNSIFYLFSSSTLRGRWTELKQNWLYARKWMRFENVCLKSKVYPSPSPTNRELTTHLFRRLRNSTANLTAYIFRTKHEIRNRTSVLETTGVFYVISKCHKLWSTNGSKLDLHFTHPP